MSSWQVDVSIMIREGMLQKSSLIDLYQHFMPDQRIPECHSMGGDERKSSFEQRQRRNSEENGIHCTPGCPSGIIITSLQGSCQWEEFSFQYNKQAPFPILEKQKDSTICIIFQMHIYILADQFLSHTSLVSYIKLQSHVLCSYRPVSIYNHMVIVVAISSQREILQ